MPQPESDRPHDAPSKRRWSDAGLLTAFLLFLVMNIVLASTLGGPARQTRVRIPYSPTFLAQVQRGNVTSVATKGTSVQGKLRRAIRYPDAPATPATEFTTEIPEFANDNALLALLQSKGVVVNATAPSTGTSLFVTLLFVFGPVVLFVLLFVWIMRRAGGAAGGLTSFGRSRAQRVEPSDQRVTFNDWRESTRPRRS